jgi:hypothetical protein
MWEVQVCEPENDDHKGREKAVHEGSMLSIKCERESVYSCWLVSSVCLREMNSRILYVLRSQQCTVGNDEDILMSVCLLRAK